jgi:hypothetical protein
MIQHIDQFYQHAATLPKKKLPKLKRENERARAANPDNPVASCHSRPSRCPSVSFLCLTRGIEAQVSRPHVILLYLQKRRRGTPSASQPRAPDTAPKTSRASTRGHEHHTRCSLPVPAVAARGGEKRERSADP